MIATYLIFMFMQLSFSGMADHKIQTKDLLGTVEAYLQQKEISVDINGTELTICALGCETYEIDSVSTLEWGDALIIHYGGKNMFIYPDILQFSLQKFGEEHIFTLLLEEKKILNEPRTVFHSHSQR